jgi:methylated-DNA-[protein]-cysteine S-methyltransferase
MIYTCTYLSPLGNILLASDEIGLTGLWFEGQKYFANTLPDERISQETEILTEAKKWLDVYFSGENPAFTPPLHPVGSTFRQTVWQILSEIPYGQTVTYGEIAGKIAEKENISRMSAQAVGGAVGHNKISIIIPCHRVVGTNGSLTGYAGGIDKKISLLELEHADMSRLFVPKKELHCKKILTYKRPFTIMKESERTFTKRRAYEKQKRRNFACFAAFVCTKWI